MSFQMVEEKSVSSQIEDFQKLVSDLAKEGDVLPKSFVAHGLVFKLRTLGKNINTSISTIEPI